MSQRFANFSTVHCHPQSFDSGSTPEAFAKREVELGSGAICCTDHGTMGATRRIYDLAKANKLICCAGVEGYFRDDNCPILKAFGQDPATYCKYFHVTIHCRDQEAFSVLSRKLSHARLEKHGSETKPLFDWKDLEEIGAANTTIMSGCLIGMVQRHLLREGLPPDQRFKIADAYYRRLKAITRPGNYFVEVFPHRCEKNWVAGVFLGDGGEDTKLRYWPGKRLRLEQAGEMSAEECAKLFGTKKWHVDDRLVAVMQNRKWEDREPFVLAKVEHIEDFIANECSTLNPDGDVQLGANRVVMNLAKRHGDPVVISDDSHFTTPDEKVVQDVRLGQMGNWKFYGSYHRQTSDEAYAYFKQYMGISEKTFEGWVDNNRGWADGFRYFIFDSKPSLPTKFYPEDTLGHTISLIKKHGRMDKRPEYVQRLKTELDLLHRNGTIDLLPYFFIGEQVCSLYEELGLLTGPGRGSAAGLLLTYLLGITHVDPIRYGLSLERFITLDRIVGGSLPDIDQDLPTRDPLVEGPDAWLPKTFGDHFAQISVDTTLKLRSSVKDVARVTHGRVPDITETLTKKFQAAPQGVSDRDFVFGYEDSGNWVPGTIETDAALKEYVKLFPREWVIVQKVLGLQRQKGRHACAYVIANKPIADFIPLMEIGGYQVTQFTAPSVEAAGGIKIDLLVVNSLRDIQDAIKLIQDGSGIEIPKDIVLAGRRVPKVRLLPHNGELVDIWDLPEDQPVFRDVAEGRTEAVFQFGTPGALQWLKHFNHWRDQDAGKKSIDSIDAMATFTALDRPGPLDAFVEAADGSKHNMLVEYARRARGETPVGEVGLLSQLIPESEGVLCFQESLQRVYQVLMGCTGPEAEEFRRNIAKKKMEKVLKAYGPWMGTVGEKYGEDVAREVWSQVVTFGAYGFNKSHAVCYVVISYACAFLKHHYPLEWWTAVLRNASKNEINEKFWKFCGHLVDKPSLAYGNANFEIKGARIQAPISLLQGVGEKAHDQLMAGLPYADIQDLCNKVERYCVENKTIAFTKDETGKSIPKLDKDGQPVLRRATSALNRGVIYRLILAGVADALFPPETTDIVQRLEAYELAVAVSKKKRQPEKIDPKYRILDDFTLYQMRKDILPTHTEPLLQLLKESGHSRLILDGERFSWKFGEGSIPIKHPSTIATINATEPWAPGQKAWIAMPGYVVAQRAFSYKGGKSACEFEFDVAGERLKYVKWPDRNGTLPEGFSRDMVGAIVVIALSRYSEARPMGLEDVFVVRPPLGQIPVEESPSED